jgi:hypothetical protein
MRWLGTWIHVRISGPRSRSWPHWSWLKTVLEPSSHILFSSPEPSVRPTPAFEHACLCFLKLTSSRAYVSSEIFLVTHDVSPLDEAANQVLQQFNRDPYGER